jgi:hypothetical protein
LFKNRDGGWQIACRAIGATEIRVNSIQTGPCFQRGTELDNGALGIIAIEVQSPQSKVSAGVIGIQPEGIRVRFDGLVRAQHIHLEISNMTPD